MADQDEIVHEFEKNQRERVRVTLQEYRGRQVVDLRVFYDAGAGDYRPTPKGLSLDVGSAPALLAAMDELRTRLAGPVVDGAPSAGA